jgi:hypothetical protein
LALLEIEGIDDPEERRALLQAIRQLDSLVLSHAAKRKKK